jgi:hypothetical protein
MSNGNLCMSFCAVLCGAVSLSTVTPVSFRSDEESTVRRGTWHRTMEGWCYDLTMNEFGGGTYLNI